MQTILRNYEYNLNLLLNSHKGKKNPRKGIVSPKNLHHKKTNLKLEVGNFAYLE